VATSPSSSVRLRAPGGLQPPPQRRRELALGHPELRFLDEGIADQGEHAAHRAHVDPEGCRDVRRDVGETLDGGPDEGALCHLEHYVG